MKFFREIRILLSKNYIASVMMIARLSLRNQYKTSYLGMAWSLIQPALYITVMSIVFSTIMKFPLDHYPLYLMAGMLPWNLITSSLISGSNSLIIRDGILKRCMLPKTMFPVADTLVQIYTFFLSFIAMQLVMGIFIVGHINLTVLLLPLVMIPMIIFCFAGAIMLSYIAAYLRDISHLLIVLFNALFWTVPVVYPFSIIPENIRAYFELNPLYMMISPVQKVIYFGVVPSLNEIILASTVALVVVIMAFVAYRSLRKNVIYYL